MQHEVDPFPRREGTSCNGWQPTADALLTMNVSGNRWQPAATDSACFWRFRAAAFAISCQPLRPRGSIKAPCHGRAAERRSSVRTVAPPKVVRQALSHGRGHRDKPHLRAGLTLE